MDPDTLSKGGDDRSGEEKKEGEEEEEGEEDLQSVELEEAPSIDPFMTFPEPSHRAHTPAERIRPQSAALQVSSFTEYNPYIGSISLSYPRKTKGALPNSIYRRPPEIIPPPVDKWQLFKSEIGVWAPMSLTTICRKFDPAWKDREQSEMKLDG